MRSLGCEFYQMSKWTNGAVAPRSMEKTVILVEIVAFLLLVQNNVVFGRSDARIESMLQCIGELNLE